MWNIDVTSTHTAKLRNYDVLFRFVYINPLKTKRKLFKDLARTAQ
jgi:hypothetical protein